MREVGTVLHQMEKSVQNAMGRKVKVLRNSEKQIRHVERERDVFLKVQEEKIEKLRAYLDTKLATLTATYTQEIERELYDVRQNVSVLTRHIVENKDFVTQLSGLKRVFEMENVPHIVHNLVRVGQLINLYRRMRSEENENSEIDHKVERAKLTLQTMKPQLNIDMQQELEYSLYFAAQVGKQNASGPSTFENPLDYKLDELKEPKGEGEEQNNTIEIGEDPKRSTFDMVQPQVNGLSHPDITLEGEEAKRDEAIEALAQRSKSAVQETKNLRVPRWMSKSIAEYDLELGYWKAVETRMDGYFFPFSRCVFLECGDIIVIGGLNNTV